MTTVRALARRIGGRRGPQRRLEDGDVISSHNSAFSPDAGAPMIIIAPRSVSKESGAVQARGEEAAD